MTQQQDGTLQDVRVAVIGVGRMGARHARNLAHHVVGARLVGMADPDVAHAQPIARELGLDNAVADYKELVHRDDVDAVVIAAPAEDREEMLQQCVVARKAVFCEKPVAVDLAAARRVWRQVADSGILCQLGFMRRFDAGYERAFEHIRAGAIGKPVLVRLTSRDATGPSVDFVRTSGGLFVDSSVHDFDLARWLMGDEIVRVFAQGGCFIYPEYKSAADIDVGTVSFSFRNGGLGLHDNSRHTGYGYDIRTEVLGTEGAIQIGYLQRNHVVLLKNGHSNYDYVPDFLERFADAYLTEMQHFVDCVRIGAQPRVTVEDGVRSLEIAEAASASLRSGQPQAVETVDLAAAAG